MKNTSDNRFIVSVKVGPKGQITIPKEARDMFDIKVAIKGETRLIKTGTKVRTTGNWFEANEEACKTSG